MICQSTQYKVFLFVVVALTNNMKGVNYLRTRFHFLRTRFHFLRTRFHFLQTRFHFLRTRFLLTRLLIALDYMRT